MSKNLFLRTCLNEYPPTVNEHEDYLPIVVILLHLSTFWDFSKECLIKQFLFAFTLLLYYSTYQSLLLHFLSWEKVEF